MQVYEERWEEGGWKLALPAAGDIHTAWFILPHLLQSLGSLEGAGLICYRFLLDSAQEERAPAGAFPRLGIFEVLFVVSLVANKD